MATRRAKGGFVWSAVQAGPNPAETVSGLDLLLEHLALLVPVGCMLVIQSVRRTDGRQPIRKGRPSWAT